MNRIKSVFAKHPRLLSGLSVFTVAAVVGGPAFATTSAPTTVSSWTTTVIGFFTDNIGSVALALIALATATIVLAIGRNLLVRVWHALASLGGSSGLGRGRR
jgi:hypothetical protein